MLAKHTLISNIIDIGIVAIIRTDNIEKTESIIKACLDGGLSSIEIPFTVKKAHYLLEHLSKNKSCILGAGTVLDATTARIAILSGASYIVSPCFDVETAKMCNRYAIPYMPGCYTPTEIIQALNYGVEIIKLFPGNLFSPSIIKTLKSPLPQINIMPTGGICLENAESWIKAGAIALGVGGDLIAGANSGNYSQITERAKKYRKIVLAARNTKA